MDNSQAKIYLGKNIARRVIRMKGTQTEIAKVLGVSVSTVNYLLNGYYEKLSIRMYMKIADAANATVEVKVHDTKTSTVLGEVQTG